MLPYFLCRCKNKLYLDEITCDLSDNFYDDIADEIDDTFVESIEVFKGEGSIWGGEAEQIIKFKYTCPKCGTAYDCLILINFTMNLPDFNKKGKYVFYVDSLDEIIPIDIQNLDFKIDEFGMFEAKEIWKLLEFLFLRWSILGYEIIVISPFIDDRKGFPILLNSAIEFSESKPLKGRFNKIITRKPKGAYRRSFLKKFEESLKERVPNVNLRYCIDEDPYDYLFGIFKFYIDNPNVYKEITDFHAKMYAGISESGDSEVVITSLNLIEAEIKKNQIENFAFKKIKKTDLYSMLKKLK